MPWIFWPNALNNLTNQEKKTEKIIWANFLSGKITRSQNRKISAKKANPSPGALDKKMLPGSAGALSTHPDSKKKEFSTFVFDFGPSFNAWVAQGLPKIMPEKIVKCHEKNLK